LLYLCETTVQLNLTPSENGLEVIGALNGGNEVAASVDDIDVVFGWSTLSFANA